MLFTMYINSLQKSLKITNVTGIMNKILKPPEIYDNKVWWLITFTQMNEENFYLLGTFTAVFEQKCKKTRCGSSKKKSETRICSKLAEMAKSSE